MQIDLAVCYRKRCLLDMSDRGKYGEEEGGWWSGEVRDGYGVGLWKSIMKERNTLLGHFSFVMGNERRVKFWTDK